MTKISSIKFDERTAVQIGKPAIYPQSEIDELKKNCYDTPLLKTAYIAWIYIPSANEPAHYIFGFEIDDKNILVFDELVLITTKLMHPDQLVDFLLIDPLVGGVNDYFLKSDNPFYVRK